MATISEIKFKRSKTAGQKPAVASLKEGELAINLVDKKLFTKTGDKVEDLTLRSGGKIDGDVTQVGNYTQTGSTTISNELTVGMDITAKRNVNVSGQVVADSDIRAMNGSIRTRARTGSNSHIWFEGDEMARINYERAVMYASPQTEKGGQINLRVQNGSGANQGQTLFAFNGNGNLSVPADVLAQRSRLSIESIAPTMNTNRLLTSNKPFGNQQYGWEDLVQYKAGENGAAAINYVYKGRASQPSTIWHHILDDRTGAENSWYTGSGPEQKMYSLASRNGKGHGFYSGSLMVGANNLGEYSGLGNSSIALGDNDTGFRWDGDGKFSVMANARRIAGIDSTTTHQFNIRKCTIITHTDNNDANSLPPTNNAILQIDTSKDGNNSGGNGLTLLGYNANGAYHHYFRGNGAANFNMAVNIDNNQLQMTGAGPAEKIVINYAENGSGYLRGRRAGAAHWWLGCGSSGSSEAAFYNNLTGASVSLTTKIALNKPTDVQSVLTILDNGSLIFTKSGANPRNTRIFHAGDATRGNRLEIADDSSYLMYIERHPTIGVQLVTNGGHIKTNAGNVYTNTIQLNSGAQFVADGNIYLPNTTHGFSAGWLLQQINSRLNAAVQKSGDTMSGTLTMNSNIAMQEVEGRGIKLGNGSGTGIFQGRDGASNDYANIEIRSWYGVGFKNTQNSGAQFYNKNTIFMNLRNGQIQAYDYVTRSDRAYKENIKLIESASEKISKISGYTYNIKGSSEEIRSVGVIAQEVREVLPDAVSENEDGLLSVNYNAIIATLVQSNKEMQERIKALEKSHF